MPLPLDRRRQEVGEAMEELDGVVQEVGEAPAVDLQHPIGVAVPGNRDVD